MTIKKYLQIYKNSRDNDDGNMNGLFLFFYPSIEAFYLNINEEHKLQDIFKNNNCLKLSMNELKISEKYFININTPEDYEKYIKRG